MNCEQCGKPLAWTGEVFQHEGGLIATEGGWVPVKIVACNRQAATVRVIKNAMVGNGQMLLAGTELELPLVKIFPNSANSDYPAAG